MSGILISFHTPSNAGYAMAPLERTFYEVGVDYTKDANSVHFAFQHLEQGMPTSLPSEFNNVIAFDRTNLDHDQLSAVTSYISQHSIDTVFCFDLQPHSAICSALRSAGVTKLISYWGSTMSGYNSGLKLLLKKLEVRLRKHRPDLFIFESASMQSYATQGRGIPFNETYVIPTGIDEVKFSPDNKNDDYLTSQFSIPAGANVAFYSGHMEERKGVAVIMRAALELIDNQNHEDLYFLICGNRPGEEQIFIDMLKGSKAEKHVIFAGYRTDLAQIMPCCNLGLIASTGWDSFPMSSIEMAACGLPLVVSNLQGLVETIIDGQTGFLFEPGNHTMLAEKMEQLLNDENITARLSTNGRKRILSGYTKTIQKQALLSALQQLNRVKT